MFIDARARAFALEVFPLLPFPHSVVMRRRPKNDETGFVVNNKAISKLARDVDPPARPSLAETFLSDKTEAWLQRDISV